MCREQRIQLILWFEKRRKKKERDREENPRNPLPEVQKKKKYEGIKPNPNRSLLARPTTIKFWTGGGRKKRKGGHCKIKEFKRGCKQV